LEGQDANGLLTQRAVVSRLGRLEQAAGYLPQPVRAHPPTAVVYRDHRVAAPAAQHDTDTTAGPLALGVVVGGVGHDLVESVLGVLVGLAGNQHRLGQVADTETNLLSGHGGDGRGTALGDRDAVDTAPRRP